MVKSTKKTKPRLFAIPFCLVFIDLAFHVKSFDPLNPVKLWGLGIFAGFALAVIVSEKSSRSLIRNKNIYRIYSLLLLMFVIVIFVDLLMTPVKSVAIFGDSGRNIGFLNYLFLGLVALYTSLQVSFENVKAIYWTTFCLLLILSVYGFFQHFKIDFLKWQTQFNPILLTTGNPDFSASLLGLLCVICFAGIFVDFSKFLKFGLALLVAFTVLIIYWTQARQGLVATAAGVGFIVVILVWQKSRKGALTLLCLEILGAFFSILGMLQIGPLTRYFYKASINDRGYDWRAALSMFRHHPFSGVGIDRYAAFFLEERSPKYPLIYGYSQTVNNAHNVFLEIFATAGIFAGLIYLGLMLFIGYRALVALSLQKGNEKLLLTGLIAGWVVFLAQSVISVDSQVISIWGWVLGGAIVGLSHRESRFGEGDPSTTISRPAKSNLNFRGKNISFYRNLVFTGFSLILVAFVIFPMYRNETAVLRFMSLGSPTTPFGQQVYKKSAQETFHLPLLNPNYKEAIAAKMAENNFGSEAIDYFKQTIKADPRNSNSYSLLSIVYENLKNPKDAILCREALRKLDPYNANNLLRLENDYLLVDDKASALSTERAILGMAPGTDAADRAAKLLNSKTSTTKK